MKVWIVQQGCYSDRHVVAVLDNGAEARLMEKEGSEVRCEEWEVGSVRLKCYRFEVSIMTADGSLFDDDTVTDWDSYRQIVTCNDYECSARGATREEALKIAADARREYLAGQRKP